MTGPRSGNSSGDPFFADPRSLEPDQLVALVGRLQAELDRRQAVIDQQAAAIADLQRRGGGGAPPAPPPRRDAKPVAGHDFTVVFDGGSIGNPGRGYGSYQIVAPAGPVRRDALEYGDQVTNNQAEYRTLIAALEWLSTHLGPSAATTSVAIRGDSQLVLKTVTGEWKARNADLIPLRDRAQALLRAFGRTDLAWHGRGQSVRVLGH